jgi:hypothetical protein
MKPIPGFGNVDEFIASLRGPDFARHFDLLVEAYALMPTGSKQRADWITRAGSAISEAQKFGLTRKVPEGNPEKGGAIGTLSTCALPSCGIQFVVTASHRRMHLEHFCSREHFWECPPNSFPLRKIIRISGREPFGKKLTRGDIHLECGHSFDNSSYTKANKMRCRFCRPVDVKAKRGS